MNVKMNNILIYYFSDKHAGGIKVRNMGRIMKMSMFLQKKLPKEFIRQFKRYGCHCWPRGRTILGGQGKPVDEIDRLEIRIRILVALSKFYFIVFFRTCKRLFNCHRCLTINSENECNPLDFTYKVRGKDTNGSRKLHCDGEFFSEIADLIISSRARVRNPNSQT